MRTFTVAVCILMAVSACLDAQEVPIFEHHVSLALSFGDDDSAGDFLLARPVNVAIGNNNDILVADEYKIKVFDENGVGKIAFGGKGEGPEEYRWPFYVHVSSSGYISGGIGNESIHYTPGCDYIRKLNYALYDPVVDLLKENELFSFNPGKTLAINGSDFILYGSCLDRPLAPGMSDPVSSSILISVKDDKAEIVVDYVNDNVVQGRTERGTTSRVRHVYLGAFHWDIAAGNRIVYTHTGYDKKSETGRYSYTLKVFDLGTSGKSELTFPYNPVAIPDSVIDDAMLLMSNSPGRTLSNNSNQPYADNMRERLREAKFLPPVYYILADREYVFAFIYDREHANKTVAQVIDVQQGALISTVVFPKRPWVIKNGNAYSLVTGEDAFPVVEKYRIDPAVYGK